MPACEKALPWAPVEAKQSRRGIAFSAVPSRTSNCPGVSVNPWDGGRSGGCTHNYRMELRAPQRVPGQPLSCPSRALTPASPDFWAKAAGVLLGSAWSLRARGWAGKPGGGRGSGGEALRQLGHRSSHARSALSPLGSRRRLAGTPAPAPLELLIGPHDAGEGALASRFDFRL